MLSKTIETKCRPVGKSHKQYHLSHCTIFAHIFYEHTAMYQNKNKVYPCLSLHLHRDIFDIVPTYQANMTQFDQPFRMEKKITSTLFDHRVVILKIQDEVINQQNQTNIKIKSTRKYFLLKNYNYNIDQFHYMSSCFQLCLPKVVGLEKVTEERNFNSTYSRKVLLFSNLKFKHKH